MLTCVYPSENFKTKAAAMKHGGKSKKKLKLLSMKEHPGFAKTNIATPLTNNEVGHVRYSYFIFIFFNIFIPLLKLYLLSFQLLF